MVALAGVTLLVSYLIGSIPFSFLIPKLFYGIDITRHGSGNVGATNVVRTIGRVPGIVCFALDVAKGAGPVAAAQLLTHAPGWLPVVAACGAIVGHSFSIFLRGKGGKAVATGVGTILSLNVLAGLAVLVVWAIVFRLTRVVSIASIIAAVVLPGVVLAMPRPGLGADPPAFVAYAIVAAIYVIARHRSNIRRIILGTEPRFGAGARSADPSAPVGPAGDGPGSGAPERPR